MSSDHEQELIEAYAKIAALEEEVRALRLALDVTGSIDQRTGMPNRNAMLDAIEERKRWFERQGDPFAVMLVFLEGKLDAVHAGALVAAALREVDRVCSWGEWVFGAVLPGLQEHHFEIVARRVRRALEVGRVTPERVVFGASNALPGDHLLRAMEARAEVAPNSTIVEL